ncbi:MAG: acyltransferase domain-containing protein [Kouleothrix sp.]|nr:acyltransferase domain-containing protein [Kouleothrix sp.]
MNNLPAPDAPTGLEIAIIGMSGRFPGAPDIDRFWQNLCAGVESISSFSDQQLLDAGVDPATLANANYVKAGAVLADADRFDAAFFNYSPREAELIDPQQRLLLECAWAALEHAGYDPERYAGLIGVFAGVSLNSYWVNLLLNRDLRAMTDGFETMIRNDRDHATTRISYKLNLRGPSVTVQTACSTALVAVHLASQSLLSGECDMALAGGASVGVAQQTGYMFQPGGVQSPDGHCRAFDAQARGTVAGSGLGLVVLKRLADALADHDTIHAVIKGSAINNDGAQKVGYTAPSVEGQARVIRAAQLIAEVAPESIGYVEAHGTGTPLGDPIEIAALTRAFRAGAALHERRPLGSVKTNIGHLDAAAGIAGLIKTVLALKHAQIPPSLHFHQPNPQIDFAASPFYVNAQLAAWPAGPTPRRAGVSSFGIGGTNAHVVLEQAPPAPPSPPAPPHQLLLLSARSPSALDQATAALATALATTTAPLADIASTLQCGRRAFPYRRALVGADPATLARQLTHPERLPIAHAPATPPPVALLIPGQGAQHPGMTRTLYATAPVFRATVDTCAALLQPHLACDLRTLLYPPPHQAAAAAAQLDQTALTQPAVFTVCYALAQQWLAWGLRPTALLGHSLGEFVAACLAGVFHLPDALALVATRGRLMQTLPPGHMLSVALPAAALPAWLGPDLDLAAVNGPASCVVAGPPAAVAALADRLQAAGVAHRRLASPRAFHSAMMAPIADAFAQAVAGVARQAPQLACVAGVSGTWLTAAEATDPAYWARQLRAPVQFAAGVATLVGAGQAGVLLEVGPGQTLRGLAQGQAGTAVVLASLGHADDAGTPEDAALAAAQGQLWQAGVGLDWAAIQGAGRRRVPLPTYPFARQRFWIAPPAPGAPHRRSLLKQPAVDDWLAVPSWRRTAPPAPADLAAERRGWLVFADAAGLSAQLAQQLEQAGQLVVTIAPGDSFAQLGPHAFAINPRQRADYAAVLAATAGLEPPLATIVHAWGLGPADPTRAAEARFGLAHARGFGSLLLLAQALEARPPERRQIVLISTELYDVHGEAAVRPEKVSALALCKVIPQEYPHLSCRSIDCALPAGPADAPLLGQLLAELAAPARDSAVAYRGSYRWAQAFEPILPASLAARPHLREHGTYLLLGTAGARARPLAEYLVRSAHARLALVGPPGQPGNRELADALHALGGAALAIEAELADPAALRAAIERAEQQLGPLHGLIDVSDAPAGVPAGLIAELDPQACADALWQIARRLAALEAALGTRTLDFCLLQSSLAAVLGGLGMAAYSAAGLLLDAWAGAQPGWTSVGWDGWQLPGEPGDQRGQAALTITADEVLQVFARLLRLGALPHVLVSSGELAARLAQWVERPAAPPADDIPAAELHPRPSLPSAYAAPSNEIERRLAAIWQQLFGVAQLGVYDNFFELGGDSLLATQLVSRMRDAFQVELPLRSLFESSTIADLALVIAHQLLEQVDHDLLAELAGTELESDDSTGEPPIRED